MERRSHTFFCFGNAFSHIFALDYIKTALLNLFRFHSPLTSIAAFPFTVLRMHDRCDNKHGTSNVACIISQQYLLYLSTACFLSCSKVVAIFKNGLIRLQTRPVTRGTSPIEKPGVPGWLGAGYRLSFANMFFHQHMRNVKKRSFFSQSFTSDNWR